MSELNYLAHHGIEGQKHGYRRFQNLDGSLTPLGRVHYGVGEARKKATATAKKVSGAVKKAPKNISKAAKSAVKSAKKTAKNLSKQRDQAIKASQKRKEKRQKERIAALSRKLSDKAAKTKISQLKDELEEAKLEQARKKVAKLAEKNNRAQEAALLKAQERMLKKEGRKLVKDADKAFSKKDLALLSDQDLDARLARLKKEAEVARYEAARFKPELATQIGNELSRNLGQAAGAVAKDLATSLGRKYLGLNEPTDTAKNRATKLRDMLDEMKAQKELDDWRSTGGKDPDEDLARQAKKWQNLQTIATSKKTIRNVNKPNAEDASKEAARAINERKELERRAKAYRRRSDDGEVKGLSISEIAKRMGLTENQVKDLLYE